MSSLVPLLSSLHFAVVAMAICVDLTDLTVTLLFLKRCSDDCALLKDFILKGEGEVSCINMV